MQERLLCLFYYVRSLCNDQVFRHLLNFVYCLVWKYKLGRIFPVQEVLSLFTLLLRNGKGRLAKFGNLVLHTE